MNRHRRIKRISAGLAAFAIVFPLGADLLNQPPVRLNSVLTANAADEAEYESRIFDNTLRYIKYSDHIEITGIIDLTAIEILLPAEIDGLPVTSIASRTFNGCTNLTSLTIPDNVTDIGELLFNGCDSLKSVSVPKSVTNIKEGAFLFCYGLENITVDSANTAYCGKDGVLFDKEMKTLICCPAGKKDTEYTVPDTVEHINNSAFYSCSNMTSITLPDSLADIGGMAFLGCTSLNGITIPENVTSIENYTFNSCSALTSVKFNGRIKKIGEAAFDSCFSLAEIELPDSIESIGGWAFSRCFTLPSITIPKNTADIGDCAFFSNACLKGITVDPSNTAYCDKDGVLFDKDMKTIICYPAGKNEESYSIPDSVTAIEDNAFSSCSNLLWLIIPDSVKSIGFRAFVDCFCMKSLTIPSGVENIDSTAFLRCYNLDFITVDPSNTSYCDKDGVLFDKDMKTILCYPSGKKDSVYAVPQGVTAIADSSFAECVSLIQTVIPDSVTHIGDGAFNGCSAMTSVLLPESVAEIGLDAFAECTSLSSVSILNPLCVIYDSMYTFGTTEIIGHKGSTAEEYARKYIRKFEIITAPGDIDGNSKIDSVDASMILKAYAQLQTNGNTELSEAEKLSADVDSDGQINAVDASLVLSYYAAVQTGFDGDFNAFLNKE